MEQKVKLGKRVVLFPLPWQTHQIPMLKWLGNLLYSKGFSITVIHTPFNFPNTSDYPHFTFHSIPHTMLEGEGSKISVVAVLNRLDINNGGFALFKEFLSQIILFEEREEDDEKKKNEPVACLITDAVWHFTQAVADSLEIPRLVFDVLNALAFCGDLSLSLFKQKGYLSAQGSQLEEPVPELPPLKVKDIHKYYIGSEVIYEMRCKTAATTKVSRGLILNSFEELEPSSLAKIRQDINLTPVFAIGPLYKQVLPSLLSSSHDLLSLMEDQSCIPWLNAQTPKSVLYISFGTMAYFDEAEFVEIAWGLADSEQPFLWVIRPGLVRDVDGTPQLPDGFLEKVEGRGRIVAWAPQKEVLAHPSVGGFWTQNGWNSTMECICEGLPMISRPYFAEQLGTARYVTDVWKAGLHLEGALKREDIVKTIRKLMVEKEGEEMRERATCLKEKASLCLAEGGSSYKSMEALVAYILSF